MSRRREFAKFFCGVEACHAFVHGYFWLSGTTLQVFGFHQTPTWNLVGAIVNGIIALALGLYAWRGSGHRVGASL